MMFSFLSLTVGMLLLWNHLLHYDWQLSKINWASCNTRVWTRQNPPHFAPFGNSQSRQEEDRRFAGRMQMDKQTSGWRDVMRQTDSRGKWRNERGRLFDSSVQSSKLQKLQDAQTWRSYLPSVHYPHYCHIQVSHNEVACNSGSCKSVAFISAPAY